MSVSCFKYVKSYQILTKCKSTIIIIANIKQIGKNRASCFSRVPQHEGLN